LQFMVARVLMDYQLAVLAAAYGVKIAQVV
jgi:hypothetical protein